MSNISSVNNYYANIFKTGSLSKADAGTAELLSNVFKAKNSFDYRNHDGDSLSLSSSSKGKQVMEDLMHLMQMLQASGNVTTGQVAQNNASALEQTTSISVQSISFQVTSVQVSSLQSASASRSPLQIPDSVKKFLEEHTPGDLQKMSLEQIPDDVLNFAKEVASFRISAHHRHQHHHGMGWMNGSVNPDDAAQQLVNSLFSDANSQNSSDSADDLLKMVTDALDKTYEGLNKNAENLPQGAYGNLNSIYTLAQQKITQWASDQGITIG